MRRLHPAKAVTLSMFLKLTHLLLNAHDSVTVDEIAYGVVQVISHEIFVDNATHQDCDSRVIM